jgi:CHAT domain-containing protein/tetratricopeptide (TPR) repeat protein
MACGLWVCSRNFFNENLFRILLTVMLAEGVSSAQGVSDPAALQKRAIERIDRCRDAFYRTVPSSFLTMPPLPAMCAEELGQAKQELQASNQAFHARRDYAAEAVGTMKLAGIEGMLQHLDAKGALLVTAVQIANQSGDAKTQGQALTSLASLENQKGDLQSAALHIGDGVRLATQAGSKRDLVDALDVAGEVETKRNNLIGASEYLNRAVELGAQVDDPKLLVSVYEDRGYVWSQRGQQCDYKRDFKLCSEEIEAARSDYLKSVEIAQRSGYSLLVGMAKSSLPLLDAYEKQFGAIAGVDTQLESSTFHITKPSQVIYHKHFSRDENPSSAALGRTMMKQNGFRLDSANPNALEVEGGVLEWEGHRDAALSLYLKAVDLVEKDRIGLRDEQSRTSLLESRIGIYYDALLELLDHNRMADAFDMMERSRSRAMVDLLYSRPPNLGLTVEGLLLAQATNLNGSIVREQSKLFKWSGEPQKHKEEIAQAQTTLGELQAQDRVLQQQIAKTAPRLRNLLQAKLVSLREAQAAAGKGQYDLLYYLVVGDGLILWHISADDVQVLDVYFSSDLVSKTVGALRESMSRGDGKFDEVASRELFLVAINPVLKSLKTKHLVIVPHEGLNLLPFQVLQDPSDGRYLGEKFEITYAPSATVLASLEHLPNLAGGRLLAVAFPGMTDSMNEVRSISSLYRGRSKTITDVTLKNDELTGLAKDYNLLHLSMHGEFQPIDPMFSFLLLRKPSVQDDGRFTAADMFGLPLPKNSLVVLSACETGQVKVTHGNELLGMERALLYAGASTLVLTSWEVHAPSTALWMRTFYREAQTKSPSEAARLALIAVKTQPEYANPFYWGPFLMTGN